LVPLAGPGGRTVGARGFFRARMGRDRRATHPTTGRPPQTIARGEALIELDSELGHHRRMAKTAFAGPLARAGTFARGTRANGRLARRLEKADEAGR
jgi:hypothetical protein